MGLFKIILFIVIGLLIVVMISWMTKRWIDSLLAFPI